MDWTALPPLTALRALAAYADTGSMAEAGARLNVSHAAISQQIRALQGHLGVALVERRGRSVRLTEAGEELGAAVTGGFALIGDAVARITGQGGAPVARCTVERLMRELGLRGVRRGQPTITTRPDQHAGRAPDLVDRDFTAARPNQLWVVDLTYVPTWSGTVFTAFVSDVYSRRIVGWRCAARMPTELPLDALEMALWTREHAGHTTDGRLDGLIHHSDAGSTRPFATATGWSRPVRWPRSARSATRMTTRWPKR